MDAGTVGFIRGNRCVWDGEHWRLPNGTDAERVPLDCPQCHASHTPAARDACLNRILNAEGACCGHGVHPGYVNWVGVGAPATWQQRAYVGE